MRLRLASYNLHKCRGTFGPYAPEQNLAVIAGLGADIVALQEVDFRMGLRPEALPRDMIEAATGLVPVDHRRTSDQSLGWHGQTILLRPDLAAMARSLPLALPGVEPRGAASLAAALEHGGPVTLTDIDPFVDGAAVKRIGAFPFEVIEHNQGRTHLLRADEGAVCTEMLALYQNEGIIAEPAGALSVAGLAGMKVQPGSTVVCVISGGNNDVIRYTEIMERSLVHRGLRHYFLVNFPQEAGQLRHFLNDILGEEDDIVLFEYLKKNNRETGAALVGIELAHAEDLGPLLERMEDSPIGCRRLEPGTPEYDYIVAG